MEYLIDKLIKTINDHPHICKLERNLFTVANYTFTAGDLPGFMCLEPYDKPLPFTRKELVRIHQAYRQWLKVYDRGFDAALKECLPQGVKCTKK
ncbi:MAG: hypothetical protein V3U78_04485 [Thiotrichaceae bacterium]